MSLFGTLHRIGITPQAVLEQLRDPLRVPHIGLAARDSLHVRGAPQPALQHLLQAVERALPPASTSTPSPLCSPRTPAASPASPATTGSSSRTSGSHCAGHRAARAAPACGRTPSPKPSAMSSPATRSNMTSMATTPRTQRRTDGVARRVLCQDTDPRARSNNHRHPRTPRHTPLRAHPRQGVATSPDDASTLHPDGEPGNSATASLRATARPQAVANFHPHRRRSKIAIHYTSCITVTVRFVGT